MERDTCPECVCDADIASPLCRNEDRLKKKREQIPSIKRNATTCTGMERKRKGEERSPRCRQCQATYFRRFALDPPKRRWRYGGTTTEKTEPEGESDQPSIQPFDASHYGNTILRASLENYVDVMPHLLASSPPSYHHPYPLFLLNLLASDSLSE